MANQMISESIDVDALNQKWHNRCCVFKDGDRSRVGIIEQFHHDMNMVTVSVGPEVLEVPRQNVYL